MREKRNRIEERIESVLNRQWSETGPFLLTAAFSGGEDSTVLLHALCRIRDRWNEQKEAADPEKGKLPLLAIYVHHGLRAEADEEERILRQLASSWKVDFRCLHVDVQERVRETGETLEEAARLLRYEALNRMSREEMLQRALPDYRILTAHHAEDQAETILMNLIRGTSLRGLTGMKEQSGRILRPMLEVEKQEIREYLNQYRLSHVEDQSNQDPSFRRNKIRLEVLPLLRQINPKITESLERMSRILSEDEAYLDEETRKAWKDCVFENPEKEETLQAAGAAKESKAFRAVEVSDKKKAFSETIVPALNCEITKKLPGALRMRVLQLFLQKNGGLKDITEVQLKLLDQFLDAADGKRIDLTGRQVLKKAGNLEIRIHSEKGRTDGPGPREKSESFSNLGSADFPEPDRNSDSDGFGERTSFPVSLPRELDQWIPTPWGEIRFRLVENPGKRIREFSGGRYTKYFSCDIITENLCLRNRRTGDFLCLRDGKQSLQDLMVNQKIPKEDRDRIPLLMNDRECIWIIGGRINERYWIQPEAPQAVLAEFREG